LQHKTAGLCPAPQGLFAKGIPVKWKNGKTLAHRFTVYATTSVELLLSIAPFMLL
jgi:hypothetical protein